MKETASLLSREELAALTESIADGSFPTDTGFNLNARVVKHDLTNEDSSLGVNVSSLDMVNERFIRLFRLALLEALRTTPRINPTRVQLMKFGEYLKGKTPPMSVNVVRMNPLRGSMMVLIDPNIIFSALDNFFGGAGRGASQLAPGRLFTPTESRIINIILDVFFRTQKEAWSPMLAVDFDHVSSEINPQFAQIADENELVIVSHFEAEVGDSKGFLDVVLPYASLKPIRELLRSRVQAVDGDDASDKAWHQELGSALGHATVEMQIVLGQIQSTLGAFQAFKPGDLVYFKKPDLARVIVNGIPSFEAQVGTMGPNMAVQIERQLNPFKKPDEE